MLLKELTEVYDLGLSATALTIHETLTPAAIFFVLAAGHIFAKSK